MLNANPLTRQPANPLARHYQPTNQLACQPAHQPTSLPDNQPADQPTSQPTDQATRQADKLPTNQPTNQSTNPPASRPANQPISHKASQPTNQPTSQPANQPSIRPTTSQPTNQPARVVQYSWLQETIQSEGESDLHILLLCNSGGFSFSSSSHGVKGRLIHIALFISELYETLVANNTGFSTISVDRGLSHWPALSEVQRGKGL